MEFNPGNHKTQIFYGKRGDEIPDECVIANKVQYPQKFMLVTGITGRGPLKCYRVPKDTKFNAIHYRDAVLKPIIEKELPKIYPGEMHKVFLHHDKCTSHTSSVVMQYLREVNEK